MRRVPDASKKQSRLGQFGGLTVTAETSSCSPYLKRLERSKAQMRGNHPGPALCPPSTGCTTRPYPHNIVDGPLSGGTIASTVSPSRNAVSKGGGQSNIVGVRPDTSLGTKCRRVRTKLPGNKTRSVVRRSGETWRVRSSTCWSACRNLIRSGERSRSKNAGEASTFPTCLIHRPVCC